MDLCGYTVGLDAPLFLIAGPCVIESEQLALASAERLRQITEALGIPFIYKSSFDKANRSSQASYRGPGLADGLRILERVRTAVEVPVLTDVHEYTPLDEVAEVVDVMQTPAFLCRQTDFIQNVARCGKPLNVKKGQFMAPWEMGNVVDKARATGRLALAEPDCGHSDKERLRRVRQLYDQANVFETAFSLCREGVLSGTELEIRRVEAAWSCPACRRKIPRDDPKRCASCGVDATLTGGDELILEQIEMEVP